MQGVICKYFESKGFGFIAAENGEELYFRDSYMVGNLQPKRGASVGFKKKKSPKGFEARNVIFIHKTASDDIDNKQALNEISRWRLDAKMEDMNRYFYQNKEYHSIIERDKCYLIGRKGSGKTRM